MGGYGEKKMVEKLWGERSSRRSYEEKEVVGKVMEKRKRWIFKSTSFDYLMVSLVNWFRNEPLIPSISYVT